MIKVKLQRIMSDDGRPFVIIPGDRGVMCADCLCLQSTSRVNLVRDTDGYASSIFIMPPGEEHSPECKNKGKND